MFMAAVYILGAVFFAFAAFVFTMRILRRWASRAASPPPTPAFDMAELQAMLKAGEITPEEFERLRISSINQLAHADTPHPRAGGFEVLPPK